LETILEYLGEPLPRHALMGLTGHAWHLCLATRPGITALPSGPTDLDWEAAVRRYARTGISWERFGAALPPGEDWSEMRDAAIEWAIPRLDAGRPLIGFDFHLHEHAVVYGYDWAREGFLVDDVITPEVGPIGLWRDWPSSVGLLELFAPGPPVEVDPGQAIAGALQTALDCFAGVDGPDDGQSRGTAALDAWADAMEGEGEVDRAGNAYTLQVLQAARLDGADFLAQVAEGIPELAPTIGSAERAIRDETTALAPLLTLFPFPSGGHGNVSNAGLRRGAAMALRRAARHERDAAAAIEDAMGEFGR
jgi:hypothetical protein